MYFTNAIVKNKVVHYQLEIKKQKNYLVCYTGKTDMIILNHTETWQHKVGEWKSILVIVKE